MRSKVTKAVSCAAIAALTLCLTGCGSTPSASSGKEEAAQQEQQTGIVAGTELYNKKFSQSYIEVNGQTYSSDEWDRIIEGNSLAAESYVGKQITLVAPVSNVSTFGYLLYTSASGRGDFYESPVGDITIRFGSSTFDIDIPKQYQETATMLKRDDMIKITGTITDASAGFSLINGPIDGIPNSGPITIEKLS